jgi:hypothetical protein
MKKSILITLLCLSFKIESIQGSSKHHSFKKGILHSQETKNIYLEVIKGQTGFTIWIVAKHKLLQPHLFYDAEGKKETWFPILMKGGQKMKLDDHQTQCILKQIEKSDIHLLISGCCIIIEKSKFQSLLAALKHHYSYFSLPTFDIEAPKS